MQPMAIQPRVLDTCSKGSFSRSAEILSMDAMARNLQIDGLVFVSAWFRRGMDDCDLSILKMPTSREFDGLSSSR